MLVIKVCDQGNIWFFGENSSDKNKVIAADKNGHHFFEHPAKSNYLVLIGEAKIILDKEKIKEL
jgi:general stress protein 26